MGLSDGQELALIEGQIIPEPIQPLTLFGTADPVEVLDRAAKVAKALAGVIDKQELYRVIGTKKHVQVEGWTLLGSMLGVFPRVEWTRKLEDGWEARVVAVVASTGAVIGAGEAMCTRAENSWKQRDDFAVRGMAQTRAISRAMRGPLGFVVQLAGYASTPAEEMSHEPHQGARTVPTPLARPSNSGAPSPAPAPTLIDGQGAGGSDKGYTDPPYLTPLEKARKHAKPASAGYDDTTAVCGSCGRAEFLRPRGPNPRFCAKQDGGCGAPARGAVLELLTYAEWRQRQG